METLLPEDITDIALTDHCAQLSCPSLEQGGRLWVLLRLWAILHPPPALLSSGHFRTSPSMTSPFPDAFQDILGRTYLLQEADPTKMASTEAMPLLLGKEGSAHRTMMSTGLHNGTSFSCHRGLPTSCHNVGDGSFPFSDFFFFGYGKRCLKASSELPR
jgi:hypothetical protein